MNDELLVSYLLDEADEATREQVEQWIVESPSNQRYFEHFRLIWETSIHIAVPEVNEQDAWQRFQKRIAPPAPKQEAVIKTIGSGLSRLRIAATVLVTLGILTLAYLVWNKTASAPVTIAAVDRSMEETLPDGSMVTLNKHSEITYAGNFKGEERSIRLRGEAFFNVKPDKNKPFVVHVNDVTVTVLGTSFNIRTENGITEVIVETGMVKVEKKNKAVQLRQGEKITVEQKDSVLVKEEENEKLYNYYRTREFVCDNTPLWKLVEILNEAYDAHIVIENKELRNLPLTTTFQNESLDNILGVIGETFDISVQRKNDQIILK